MTITTAPLTKTKQEWQCYLDTPEQVVELVNGMTGYILDHSQSPIQALKDTFKMLNFFQEYGFRDTECEVVAQDIVNAYYWDAKDVYRFDVYM